MATKAELEAELAALKQEASARRDAAAAEAAGTAREAMESGRAEAGKAALADFLKAHGIDGDSVDLDALWHKLSEEIGALSSKQPILTAIAIFALGFILGRSSR